MLHYWGVLWFIKKVSQEYCVFDESFVIEQQRRIPA